MKKGPKDFLKKNRVNIDFLRAFYLLLPLKNYERIHYVAVKAVQSCSSLATPQTVYSMELSRPEYWSG